MRPLRAVNKYLWASEIHYLNDSAELTYTVNLLLAEIRDRTTAGSVVRPLFGQLERWLGDRIAGGHLLFVAAFSEKGNLLSQWRGYCDYGKGLSIGFSPEHLLECAAEQRFLVGQCIYDRAEHKRIAALVLDKLEEVTSSNGEAPPSKAHPTQSYYPVFATIEDDLLRIAALLKSPAFSEEAEWRAVSPVVSNYVQTDILYRPARSTLVPYTKFALARGSASAIEIEHAFLGPTPNINLSMNALSMYLARSGASPRRGITASQIPYREA